MSHANRSAAQLSRRRRMCVPTSAVDRSDMITDAGMVPAAIDPLTRSFAAVLTILNDRNREIATLRARLGERDEELVG